jgi:hypothetical protein
MVEVVVVDERAAFLESGSGPPPEINSQPIGLIVDEFEGRVFRGFWGGFLYAVGRASSARGMNSMKMIQMIRLV